MATQLCGCTFSSLSQKRRLKVFLLNSWLSWKSDGLPPCPGMCHTKCTENIVRRWPRRWSVPSCRSCSSSCTPSSQLRLSSSSSPSPSSLLSSSSQTIQISGGLPGPHLHATKALRSLEAVSDFTWTLEAFVCSLDLFGNSFWHCIQFTCVIQYRCFNVLCVVLVCEARHEIFNIELISF